MDIISVSLMVMGVLYVIQNKQEIMNTIEKPLNKLMNNN